jgi:predicted CxxxxCH...CXXCH cytochrome family protein
MTGRTERTENRMKMMKILVFVCVLIFFAAPAYALDNPHTDVNTIGCSSCHYVHGNLPDWATHVPEDIDDTQYNNLCWSCHTDVEAPYMKTHSSLTTSTKYGDADNDTVPGWSIECKTCHDSHQQRQFRAYGSESYMYSGTSTGVTATTVTKTGAGWTANEYQDFVVVPNIFQVFYNYRITSNTSDTLTVEGTIDLTKVTAGDTFAVVYGKLISETITTPNSGDKAVKFYDSTGTNSFADGNATYDGICEVCHTQTENPTTNAARYRNTAHADTHNEGQKCTTCHSHLEGFKGSCTSCHGDPPVTNVAVAPDGLVWSPGVTNSSTSGTHNLHYTTLGYACDTCHYNSAGTGATHNNSLIVTMGFSLFSGTYEGGKYDGQAAVTYDATTTSPVTTVTNTGNKTCTNLYCHSIVQTLTGGALTKDTSDYKSPVWDGTVACGQCHASSPLSGSHSGHLTGYGALIDCNTCHQGGGYTRASARGADHVDGGVDVFINNITSTDGSIDFGSGTYDGTAAPEDGFGDCSTIYCHSTGQSTTDANDSTPTYATPSWGSAASGDCGTCHKVEEGAGLTSGSHGEHLGTTGVSGCSDCHTGAADDASSYSSSNHFNKLIDVANTYTAGGAPGNNYGTCSTASCHDDGTGSPAVSPTWGASVTDCAECHAEIPATASHQKHVVTTAYSKAVCGDCHDGTVQGTTAPAQHLDDDLDVYDSAAGDLGYPQDVAKGGTPYDSCSTAYCHSSGQSADGASTTPYVQQTVTWGDTVACGDCHYVTTAAGLTSGSHDEHLDFTGFAGCSECHTGAADNASSYNSTSHVNRLIDVANTYTAGGAPGNNYGTCTTNCHGTISPQWGTVSGVTDRCTVCHGTDGVNAGPPKDTAGNSGTVTSNVSNDPEVGAHQVHLQSLNNYSNDIACAQCHQVPSAVFDSGHIDSALPVEMTWGSLATTAKSGSLTPAYNFTTNECSTNWCHGGDLNGGSDTTPIWTDGSYLTGSDFDSDCSQCHGFPPSTPDHASVTANDGSACNSCHAHVNNAGDANETNWPPVFNDLSKHINGYPIDATGGDDCFDCHSSAGGPTASTTPDAYHAKHIQTAYVGKLSTNDYGNVSNGWYSFTRSGDTPDMKCGFCHPQSSSTHRNGTVNLNFDPSDGGAAGTLKAKNASTQSYSQTEGSSVTCSSVYCHSDGYNSGSGYGYKTTPQWYGGAFVDNKCDDCHGNSPATNAHGEHVVGIHYDTIYTGTTGLMTTGSGNNNSHGNTTYSTTINCNICHYNTVTVSYNDQNTVCNTCHNGSPQGDMVIDAGSTTHVNGTPDIALNPINIRSKAQIRNDITTITELDNNWDRTVSGVGYKAAGAFDESKNALNTATDYNSGTTSCAVACHNGNALNWGSSSVSCDSCHTGLP